MALAMVAPAPGSTPTTNPTTDERMVDHQVWAISLRLNIERPVALMMPAVLWCCSSISRISLMENRPITRTMNWMPSDRCTSPPVKR